MADMEDRTSSSLTVPVTRSRLASHHWPATRTVLIALAAALLSAGVTFAVAARSSRTAGAGAQGTMPGMESGTTPSTKAVYISPDRQQLVGVRTQVVRRQTGSSTLRTVGTLAYDETRVAQLHTKITGWVDHVNVDFVGRNVRRGQPLFDVYSPDLVSSQNDYLISFKALKQLGDHSAPDARAASEAMLRATRERLRRWDVADAAIDRLEQKGEVSKYLSVQAPFDGIVLERNVFAGQYVTPELMTFKIADLSTIWALGQVFEYELPRVSLGQEVVVEFPYGQSAKPLVGRLSFIAPEVDPQTRRIRIRAEFKNPGLAFKPETFVTLVIRGEAREELLVPKEAVLDNGDRQYALLALPNGYFEPRDIKVGPPVGGSYPVLSGLVDGDNVSHRRSSSSTPRQTSRQPCRGCP